MQMIWEASSGEGKVIKSECTYSSSGKIPLLSATGAFFALAMAMVIQHTYLLVAVSKSDSLLAITWDPDSDFAKSLTWQAGFFFVTTWYVKYLFYTRIYSEEILIFPSPCMPMYSFFYENNGIIL